MTEPEPEIRYAVEWNDGNGWYKLDGHTYGKLSTAITNYGMAVVTAKEEGSLAKWRLVKITHLIEVLDE